MFMYMELEEVNICLSVLSVLAFLRRISFQEEEGKFAVVWQASCITWLSCWLTKETVSWVCNWHIFRHGFWIAIGGKSEETLGVRLVWVICCLTVGGLATAQLLHFVRKPLKLDCQGCWGYLSLGEHTVTISAEMRRLYFKVSKDWGKAKAYLFKFWHAFLYSLSTHHLHAPESYIFKRQWNWSAFKD